MANQALRRRVWDYLRTPIYAVDVGSISVYHPRVRQMSHAGVWLYVDDRDGFELVAESTVRTWHLAPEESVMSTCIAYWEDGTLCRAPARILDDQRGGMVCLDYALDTYHCPTHGVRSRRRGEVR